LHQNYPDPFNPTTTIAYGIPVNCRVTINLYDLLGRKIKTLIDADEQRGYHIVLFDATGLASGTYFYRIEAGRYRQTKKVILLR
jgi:Secretion system C-terminal sorting domain